MFSVSTEIAALILQDLRETDTANSFVRKILRASYLESRFCEGKYPLTSSTLYGTVVMP